MKRDFDYYNSTSKVLSPPFTVPPPPKILKKEIEFLDYDVKIESLNDIIELIEKKEIYNYEYKRLKMILGDIKELNNMIGLTELKQSIGQQIMFCVQNNNSKDDLLHTVLTGSPGSGKTKVANILSKIFSKLLNNSKFYKFKIVSRADLIGEYLGQTAVKTQKAIDECLGGVLFIDEAYSLGTCQLNGGGDTFSKECMDTIVNNLALKKFICIIAGYKQDIDEFWFSANKGLERRFPWRYNVEKYTYMELNDIFKKQVKDECWKINDDDINKFLLNIFKNNYGLFECSGGDTAILFTKCKIYHSTRVFCHNWNKKRILNTTDIKNGFDVFKKHKENLKPKDDLSKNMMYC